MRIPRLAPLARLLLLPLLLAGAAGCTQQHDDFDFETCGVRPRYTLPVVFRGGVPLVDGSIGGKPTSLVLDTGATSIALTESAVRRLDLGTDAKRTVTSQGIGGSVRSIAGNLRDFRIGAIDVPDHQVAVVPDFGTVAGIDGLFGELVLSIFEVELNFPRNIVTLYAGRLCPQTVIPPWNFGYSTVNAEASARGRFLIPVELNGRQITALLDTGAANTVVARDTAAALGVTDAMLAGGQQVRLQGIGSASPVAAVYRFSSIRVGDETFANPQIFVAPRAERSFDIILGSNFLASHRVWLSYARKRVYIEYGNPRSP